MATTPRLLLPYPVGADTVDVPRDVQALAVAVDALSSIQTPIVAALPGSPVDGQECYYQSAALAAQGAIWHLRYRAGSPSTYKWELVGGSSITDEVAATENCAGDSTWRDLTTVGPQFTASLAGDYLILHGATITTGVGVASASMSLALPGVAEATTAQAATAQNAGGANPLGVTVYRESRMSLVSGQVVKGRYFAGTAQATFARRTISAIPIRVG